MEKEFSMVDLRYNAKNCQRSKTESLRLRELSEQKRENRIVCDFLSPRNFLGQERSTAHLSLLYSLFFGS